MHVLIAIAVIVSLSTILALLLIVADAVLMNYGECVISINDGEEEKIVEGGKTLLASLMDQEIFIPSACGGRGSCGLCKVTVLDGGGPLLPTEAPHLTQDEIDAQVRLSCQLKVRSDVAIHVPEEILNLREYQARVEKIVDLSYDTRLLGLTLTDPPAIEFKAGQYIQLETPAYGMTPEPVYRAYSMASTPSVHDSLELIIRRVPNGICTTFVFNLLQEGDSLKINGPYGDFFLRETDAEIIFIAGGSGIAPIRSILFRMVEEGNARKAGFFHGANELRDLYLVDEMHEFEQKLPAFTYVPSLARPAPEDTWDGETGLITEVVDRHVPDASQAEVYLCGNPDMIDAAVTVLNAKGLTEERTFYDKFA